jgi:hypothetical protein
MVDPMKGYCPWIENHLTGLKSSLTAEISRVSFSSAPNQGEETILPENDRN